MRTPSHTVTDLLQAWASGDSAALDKLVPVVYEELREQARRYLRRERPGHTLQTTDLVHETYMRLVGQRQANWQNRAQFFGVAAQIMRRVLIDHARSKHAAKRGGVAIQITLDDATETEERDVDLDVDLFELDEALTRLTALDPQQAKVVELRYFTGLGIEEAAQVLGISPATVKREWAMARAWLRRELSPRSRS
jgi:RNA polymerase sigma factor (TIGR02999 family)